MTKVKNDKKKGKQKFYRFENRFKIPIDNRIK